MNSPSRLGYISLGEKRVVKSLIENRSKLDTSYYPSLTGADIFTSAGIPRFSEEIITVYVSLDELIRDCGLSDRERLIVDQLMLGYSITDIADHYGLQKSTCSTLFSRAVCKITEWHNEVLFYVLNHNLANYKRGFVEQNPDSLYI